MKEVEEIPSWKIETPKRLTEEEIKLYSNNSTKAFIVIYDNSDCKLDIGIYNSFEISDNFLGKYFKRDVTISKALSVLNNSHEKKNKRDKKLSNLMIFENIDGKEVISLKEDKVINKKKRKNLFDFENVIIEEKNKKRKNLFDFENINTGIRI